MDMTGNMKKVVGKLRKLHPDDGNLKKCDAAYVCNRYLCNNKKRDEMAVMLGLGDRCGMCMNHCKCNEWGMYSADCRRGILSWLESE